jgi:hypothetical protein
MQWELCSSSNRTTFVCLKNLTVKWLKSVTDTGGAMFKRSWKTWIGARSHLAWIMAV